MLWCVCLVLLFLFGLRCSCYWLDITCWLLLMIKLLLGVLLVCCIGVFVIVDFYCVFCCCIWFNVCLWMIVMLGVYLFGLCGWRFVCLLGLVYGRVGWCCVWFICGCVVLLGIFWLRFSGFEIVVSLCLVFSVIVLFILLFLDMICSCFMFLVGVCLDCLLVIVVFGCIVWALMFALMFTWFAVC